MSNLAYEAIPETEVDEDDIEVVFQVLSRKDDKSIAYRLGKQELEDLRRGLTSNLLGVIAWMILRIRDGDDQTA